MTTPEQTKMVNAPQTTKMVAEEKSQKIVKIKANRAIMIGGKLVNPGDTVEANEEEAAEFCDRKIRGFYPYSGERYEDSQTHMIARAVRV